MKIKKSKIIIILICLISFILGISIGYSLNSNDNTIKYGDYITFIFEDNNKSTLSLDLKEEKYYYADNGSKSTVGDLKKLDDNIYKFHTGDLEKGYIILASTKKDQTLYIHDDYITVCCYVNGQLTLIGGE